MVRGNRRINLESTTGDITGVTAGTGLSGGGTSGSVTLNVDTSQNITSLTGGDLAIYDDQNNADVSLSMGTSATEALKIEVLNGGSNKTAEEIKFTTKTASGTSNHGKMTFSVDESNVLEINDSGMTTSGTVQFGSLSDGSITITEFVDEDTMSSNSATKLPTQQSVKAYVDSVAEGLHVKEACVVATTASFTMASGATSTTLVLADGEGGFSDSGNSLTIDGVASLALNDRILIKDGVNSAGGGVHNKWNGIYTVGSLSGSTLTLTRSDDHNTDAEIKPGDFVFVTSGTINGGHGYVMTQTSDIDLGTTAILWTQFSGAELITAGDGLDKSGNNLSVDLKSNGGLVIESTEIAVDLGASSITGTLAVGDGGTGLTAITSLLNSNNNIFMTIAVSGQDSVVAETATDTLTLVGAGGAAITTDAGADTITITTADTNTTYTAGTLLDLSTTTFNVDLSEATEDAIATEDYILFLDGGATGTTKKENIADVASLFAGTGLTASSSVIGVDTSQNITALTGGDLTLYDATNDGNPTLKIGKDGNDNLGITVSYHSGTQTIETVEFATASTSGSAHAGKFIFDVDGSDIVTINDSGLAATITTATQGTINHNSLNNFDANKHIDHTGVSVTAGSGLTGGGTIAATRTLTVGAGTGITVNTNDVAVSASQTSITSIINSSLTKIGTVADQEYITFGTSNEVNTFINDTKRLSVTATGVDITGDLTISGGDLTYGNGQNATISITDTAHDAAGKTMTISGGTTTAGTTNNIAGGSLTFQGGQGKGPGAGGDIIFKVANAAVGSASSLNSLATALTISDDKSSTFTGDVIVPKMIVGTDGATAGDVVVDNTNNGEIIWEGSTADGNENKLRATDGAGVNTLPASTGIILTTAAAITVAQGGTGMDTTAAKAVVITNDSGGTSALATAAMGTNGQLLIGGTSGPAVATLSEGNGNISITNGNGTISIATTDTNTMGSGFVLEDGDGTEVTITENKEVKFIEGNGIDIDWTDVDNGNDGDPYDLTFTCTLAAGDGITFATDTNITVGQGTGITVNTNDVAVSASQTSITSIINSSLTKIGTVADQEYITFGTANEVNTFINDTERLSVTASGVDIAGALTVTGDITAYYSSDKRLKTNIDAIESPLTKLSKISGYTFDWREEHGVHTNKGRDIGVIAQEIEEVLPEIVVERDNGYKAVRYEKIVALLIECIKEQQVQIDELKDV